MTDSPATRAWEPTMRLRWKQTFVTGAHRERLDGEAQLQQQWRCLETHETEWRPIEVEP